jgi:hypothetical protein
MTEAQPFDLFILVWAAVLAIFVFIDAALKGVVRLWPICWLAWRCLRSWGSGCWLGISMVVNGGRLLVSNVQARLRDYRRRDDLLTEQVKRLFD